MKTKIKYMLVAVLASLAFVGCATKQWDYMQTSAKNTAVPGYLNDLGTNGWKLVAIESNSGLPATYVFIRPKQ